MSDVDEMPRQKPVIVRNATDLQRLKLEKLMKNPEKKIIISEIAKEKEPPKVPEFVHNVIGSSAGAGSGEFHVFRNLRRKEYARQRYMHAKGEQERLDEEFRQRVEESSRKEQEKTSKKRAKRNKRKEKMKLRKLNKNDAQDDSAAEEAESDESQEVQKLETVVKKL